MSRRILVTGGAGFIGSHLCKRLVADGNDVVCADNFFTGQHGNIAELIGSGNFELMQHDVVQPLQVEVDQIYNLACPASPIHYQADAVQTTRTCTEGAYNVLQLARRLGIPVLQASTSEVYGDPQSHPQQESYWGNVNPVGPRACYDEGKRCAEALFFDYRRQYQVAIKVIRIFNTYGPNMRADDGRVVSNFIVQALRGEDITLYGDGSQTRSFCYVGDLVEAMVRMMGTDDSVTGPINTGNPVEFSVRQLADLVLEMVNSRSKLVLRDLPVDDPQRRRPDIAKARAVLDWEPQVQLREGLARTIAYFEHLLCHDGIEAAGQRRAPRGAVGPLILAAMGQD